MRTGTIVLLSLAVAGATAALLAGRDDERKPGPPRPPPPEQPTSLDYIEVVTDDAEGNDTLPMVVLFHGLWGYPENALKVSGLQHKLHRTRIIAPAGILSKNGHYAWWPLRSNTAKQDELAAQMEEGARAAANFIEEIRAIRPTAGAPIVAGHSQGGMMTLALATEYPHQIGGAAAASAWLPIPLWKATNVPIRAVHGRADRTISFDRTATYYTWLMSAGADIVAADVPTGHAMSKELRAVWLPQIQDLLEEQR